MNNYEVPSQSSGDAEEEHEDQNDSKGSKKPLIFNASDPLPSNGRQLAWMFIMMCVLVACSSGVLGVFTNKALSLRRLEATNYARYMTRAVVATYTTILSNKNYTTAADKLQLAKDLAESYNAYSKQRTEINIATVEPFTKRIVLVSDLRMDVACGAKCLPFDTQRSFLSDARSGTYHDFYGAGYVAGRIVLGSVTKHTEADAVFMWKTDEEEVSDLYSDAEKEATYWTVWMVMIGGALAWVAIEAYIHHHAVNVSNGGVWSVGSMFGVSLGLAVYATLLVIFTGIIANEVYTRHHIRNDRRAFSQIVSNSFKALMTAGGTVDNNFTSYAPQVVERINDVLSPEDTTVEFIMAAAVTNTTVAPAHILRYQSLCPGSDCTAGFNKMDVLRQAVFAATTSTVETDYSGTRTVLCTSSRKPYAVCEDMASIETHAGSTSTASWIRSSGIILAQFALTMLISMVFFPWMVAGWRNDVPRPPSAGRVLLRDGSRAKHIYYLVVSILVIGFSTAHTETAITSYERYADEVKYEQLGTRLQLYANTIQIVMEKTLPAALLQDPTLYRKEFLREMLVFNKVARFDELQVGEYNKTARTLQFSHMLARANECNDGPCATKTATLGATITHIRYRYTVHQTSYTGKPSIASVDVIGNIGSVSFALENIREYSNSAYRLRGYAACLVLTALVVFLVGIDVLFQMISNMHRDAATRLTKTYPILRVLAYVVVLTIPAAIPPLQSAATVQLMTEELTDLERVLAQDTLRATKAYILESTNGTITYNRHRGLRAPDLVKSAAIRFRDTMGRDGRDIATVRYVNGTTSEYTAIQPRYAYVCPLGSCDTNAAYRNILTAALTSQEEMSVQSLVNDYRNRNVNVYSIAITDRPAEPPIQLMLLTDADMITNIRIKVGEDLGVLAAGLFVVLAFVGHQLYILLLSVLDHAAVEWTLHGHPVRAPFIGLRETLRVLRAPSMPYATRLGLFVFFISSSFSILIITMVGMQREFTWRGQFDQCTSMLNEMTKFQLWSSYHWQQSVVWMRSAITSNDHSKKMFQVYSQKEEISAEQSWAASSPGTQRLVRLAQQTDDLGSSSTNTIDFLSSRVQRHLTEKLVTSYKLFEISQYQMFNGDARIEPSFPPEALEMLEESHVWYQRYILTAIPEFYDHMMFLQTKLTPLIPTVMRAKWISYLNAQQAVLQQRSTASNADVTLEDVYNNNNLWERYESDFQSINAVRDVYQHTAFRSLSLCSDLPFDRKDIEAMQVVACVTGSFVLIAFLVFGIKNLRMYVEERSKYVRVTFTFLFGLILINSIVPSISEVFLQAANEYSDALKNIHSNVLPTTPVILTQPLHATYLFLATGNVTGTLSTIDLEELSFYVHQSLREYPEEAVSQFYTDRLEKVVRWVTSTRERFEAMRTRVNAGPWRQNVACGTMLSGRWNVTKWKDMYSPYIAAANQKDVKFLNGQTAATVTAALNALIAQSLDLETFVWDAILTQQSYELRLYLNTTLEDIQSNIELVARASSDATFLSIRAYEPTYTTFLQSEGVAACLALVDAAANDTSVSYESFASQIEDTQDVLDVDMSSLSAGIEKSTQDIVDDVRRKVKDLVMEGAWRAIFSSWAILAVGLYLAVYGFHLGM
eukprot:PhF_6_TR27930/c0_g1_i1/m.41114